MKPRSILHTAALSLLAALLLSPATASAQVLLRPLAGVQTMIFNGDYPASDPISPGDDESLPFGGGLLGANNAIRVAVEIIPDLNGILRIPLVAEYYEFEGKTTFAVPAQPDRRIQQLRLRYTANMLSIGTGLTASFFRGPTLYTGLEARLNYIPPTLLTSRLFYLDNGELIVPEKSIRPDSVGQTRIGLIFRVGTQLDFFDPVLIDVNVGYGVVNALGKNTDPETQRNILTAEPKLTMPEVTLGFATFGLGIIWAF